MRLVMTLLVRDEEELLAANIDYHLGQGVDFVLVTDHGSTDATPEILDEYVRRGVARTFREEGQAFGQDAWVTRMARVAATEHGADWVINNDADEFYWPLAGTLKDMLGTIPGFYGQLLVARRDFIPRPGPGPFWERMVVREGRSQNLVGRPLEPKAVHRGNSRVSIPYGNHLVRTPRLRPAPRLPLLEIFHFPIRGYEQFEHKVVQGGLGYEALASRGPRVGRDQLKLYEIYRGGGLRDYFAESVLDDERMRAGLADGSLVEDSRLKSFLGELSSEVPRASDENMSHTEKAVVELARETLSIAHAADPDRHLLPRFARRARAGVAAARYRLAPRTRLRRALGRLPSA